MKTETPLTLQWLKSMPVNELESLRQQIISDIRNDNRTDRNASREKLKSIERIILERSVGNLFEN